MVEGSFSPPPVSDPCLPLSFPSLPTESESLFDESLLEVTPDDSVWGVLFLRVPRTEGRTFWLLEVPPPVASQTRSSSSSEVHPCKQSVRKSTFYFSFHFLRGIDVTRRRFYTRVTSRTRRDWDPSLLHTWPVVREERYYARVVSRTRGDGDLSLLHTWSVVREETGTCHYYTHVTSRTRGDGDLSLFHT